MLPKIITSAPTHGKSTKTKAKISCAVTEQLTSAFVFATRIVNYFNFKLLAVSYGCTDQLPVCVVPGPKPRPVFSCQSSNMSGSFQEMTFQSCTEVAGIHTGRRVLT